MPEQVRCPSCNSALRVPDSLLGKNVKCPKCATTFLAELEEREQSEGVVREPAPAARRSRVRDDDENLPPEEEEEDRPRRRRRRASAEAESLVSGPGTALLVVGILDIVLALLNFLLPLLGISLLAGMGGGRHGANDSELIGNLIGGIISGILGLIVGPLITVGALKMKKLRNYGLAMTACILAMIPCGNCCLLGLPFGIWALVVLNKPEVKDCFS